MAAALSAALALERSGVGKSMSHGVVMLAGSQMRWQEISLPAATPIDGKIDISLTGSAGDQPALVAEMVDWARATGFSVVAAGKGTKYLPAYHAVAQYLRAVG